MLLTLLRQPLKTYRDCVVREPPLTATAKPAIKAHKSALKELLSTDTQLLLLQSLYSASLQREQYTELIREEKNLLKLK